MQSNNSDNGQMIALKNNVITELFVDTADQNYLIARWAYHRGLYIDFFWNAAHALEKYMKAVLLTNGQSSRKYGHDLNKIFCDVQALSGELLPQNLGLQPEFEALLEEGIWRDETPTAFIERFNRLGDPDNRYNTFGYTQRWEDLHHLDQMVFIIRRLIVDLDEIVLPKNRLTVRDILAKHTKSSHNRHASSRLHKLLTTRGDDELRDAGLRLNFSFSPEGHDHTGQTIKIGGSSASSVLDRRIAQQATNPSSADGDQEALGIANWVINNIQFSRPTGRKIEQYRDILQKRFRK